MPPRFVYWTILVDNKATAFRARDREELLPTLNQLRRRNADVVMKWFARGRLWESPEAERAIARAPRPPEEKRGQDWRPGGQHKDSRDRFKRKNGDNATRGASVGHRGAGERKPWRDKPAGGAPRGNRSSSGRPPSGASRGDRPWSAKTAGAPGEKRPWRGRPGGSPRGDQPPWTNKASKPPGSAPRGDRPWSNRPPGGAPRSDRPSSGKPSGTPHEKRPWRDRPAGPPKSDRPWSRNPPGSAPRGDRPWNRHTSQPPRAGNIVPAAHGEAKGNRREQSPPDAPSGPGQSPPKPKPSGQG